MNVDEAIRALLVSATLVGVALLLLWLVVLSHHDWMERL